MLRYPLQQSLFFSYVPAFGALGIVAVVGTLAFFELTGWLLWLLPQPLMLGHFTVRAWRRRNMSDPADISDFGSTQ